MDPILLEREKWSSFTPVGTADGQVDGKITSPRPTIAAPAGTDLQLQWSARIHPISGQSWFYRESTPRIITEANLHDADAMKRMTCWVKRFHERFIREGISHPDGVELFLQLGDSDESDSCAYYFIDHGSRKEFWIDPFDPEVLGLPPVTSIPHLSEFCALHGAMVSLVYFIPESILEECYWSHVEHFPLPVKGPTAHTAVDGLLSVLSHARDGL